MDESYLTGEPYLLSKAPGSAVLSGADQRRRRLDDPGGQDRRRFALRQDHAGDARVGAAAARDCGGSATSSAPSTRRWPSPSPWSPGRSAATPSRFLAVLVVATPCPLLIAIPVAIIGSVSLAARRGIIIKDPAVLEKIDTCRTAIFDKTGTLTYGQPKLTEVLPAAGFRQGRGARGRREPGALLAPPAGCGHDRRRRAKRDSRSRKPREVSERPGEGLRGMIGGRTIQVTSRKKFAAQSPAAARVAPAARGRAGVRRPHRRSLRGDVPVPRRAAGGGQVVRPAPEARHGFDRVLLVSGDRESEVRYLAEKVGITEVYGPAKFLSSHFFPRMSRNRLADRADKVLAAPGSLG